MWFIVSFPLSVKDDMWLISFFTHIDDILTIVCHWILSEVGCYIVLVMTSLWLRRWVRNNRNMSSLYFHIAFQTIPYRDCYVQPTSIELFYIFILPKMWPNALSITNETLSCEFWLLKNYIFLYFLSKFIKIKKTETIK